MSAAAPRRRDRAAGFTLIEAVIAVAILAAAAAALLPRARLLLDYAERARRHYLAAGQLLDRTALLPTLDMARAEVGRERDTLTIQPHEGPDDLPVQVSNLPFEGSDVPISVAPAPYAYWRIDGRLGHAIVLVAPPPALNP